MFHADHDGLEELANNRRGGLSIGPSLRFAKGGGETSVLTSIEVRSLYEGDPSIAFTTLAIPILGWSEEGPLVVRNITGLEPAPATINTRNFGSLDGDFFNGSRLQKRNIVLTLGINPNGGPQSVDDIRRMCYAYGINTKAFLGLRFFFDDDRETLECRGYVETVTPNRFSKDPEISVSVICPKPNFTSLEERTITGLTNAAATSFDMNGNTVVGARMTMNTGIHNFTNEDIKIEFGASHEKKFLLENAVVGDGNLVEMSGIRGQKYIRYSGVISLLKYMTLDSLWPYLVPGHNEIRVRTPDSPSLALGWELKFFDEYGAI